MYLRVTVSLVSSLKLGPYYYGIYGPPVLVGRRTVLRIIKSVHPEVNHAWPMGLGGCPPLGEKVWEPFLKNHCSKMSDFFSVYIILNFALK